jgi:hypothetical protein
LKETVPAALTFSRERLQYAYRVSGLEAVLALGVALILDKDRGLIKRLHKCGNPSCGKFNLQLETTRKGRPRRFCTERCKEAWDRADRKFRMRRYRQRNAKPSLKEE